MIETEKEEIDFSKIENLRELMFNVPRTYNLADYEEYYVRVIIKKALSYANKEDCINYLNNISLLYKRKLLKVIDI